MTLIHNASSLSCNIQLQLCFVCNTLKIISLLTEVAGEMGQSADRSLSCATHDIYFMRLFDVNWIYMNFLENISVIMLWFCLMILIMIKGRTWSCHTLAFWTLLKQLIYEWALIFIFLGLQRNVAFIRIVIHSKV